MKISFLFGLFTALFLFSACEGEENNEENDLLTPEEEAILNEGSPGFADVYREELREATLDQEAQEEEQIRVDLDKKESEKKLGKNLKGSCNAIEEGSTCLEYYGSFWTEEQMRPNCEESGIFSFDPCPSNAIGGCNTGVGTSADMVAWMYLEGGGEMTEESVQYAQMACDATLMSKWIEAKE